MRERTLPPERWREILGILLLALAIFSLLCLFSYDPADPSFSHPAAERVRISNLCGFVGSYSADALIRFMGASTLWLPTLFLVMAIRLFKKDPGEIGGWVMGGYGGLIFATAGLLALAFGQVRFKGEALSAGGIMGSFSVAFLTSYLNTTGTLILLILVFVIALIITADLSVVVLVRAAAAAVREAWSRLENTVLEKMERGAKDLPEEELPPPPPVVAEKEPPAEAEARPVPLILEEGAPPPELRTRKRKGEQATFAFVHDKGSFQLPPLSLLDDLRRGDAKIKKESLIENARILEQKLADFGVEGRVVEVKPGPLITMYELEPAPGVKLNRITNLSEDLAMALRAPSVRIAPIPGKAVVGIEIPNQEREPVHLRDVLDHPIFLGIEVQASHRPGRGYRGNAGDHGPGPDAPPPHRRDDRFGEKRVPQCHGLQYSLQVRPR